MNKIAYFLLSVTLPIVSIFFLDGQLLSIQAQTGSENPVNPIEQGSQTNNQNTQKLENQPTPDQSLQQTEEKLEQNLNIEQRGIEIEETPDVPAGLNENVPESPEQEIQIKF